MELIQLHQRQPVDPIERLRARFRSLGPFDFPLLIAMQDAAGTVDQRGAVQWTSVVSITRRSMDPRDNGWRESIAKTSSANVNRRV